MQKSINPLPGIIAVLLSCSLGIGTEQSPATDTKPTQLCPFHPRDARVWNKSDHKFVWRDQCGNNHPDHQMAGGWEWDADARNFLTMGEALIRGKRRGGLMMLSFPDGDTLSAEWSIEAKKGQSVNIEYALSDLAVANSTNGLKFTVVATHADGSTATLLEDTFRPGDGAVRNVTLEYLEDSRKITFVHDNLGQEIWDVLWIRPEGLIVPSLPEARWAPFQAAATTTAPVQPRVYPSNSDLSALRSAIDDLSATFGREYAQGDTFLSELTQLDDAAAKCDATNLDLPNPRKPLVEEFDALHRKALIANPLVCRQPILFVTRNQYRSHYHAIDTLFHTGEYNTDRNRMHSELFSPGGSMKTIDLSTGKTSTLLTVPEGIVRDPDIYFDGTKVLFAMRRNVDEDYHIWEMNLDGSARRQLTSAEHVCDFDPIYLPDDSIVFSSTREPKYNMCSRDIAANLFRMESDGANVHQITKNTLFDNHAEVLPDGRILYARWEYVDRNFGDAHGLWTVSPDGTNQAVYWGNNTAVPGAVFNAHLVPGTDQFLCILGPHHDRLWGALGLIDRRRGVDGRAPVLKTWPPEMAETIRIGGHFDCDSFAQVHLKHEDPWPLSDKYFLCSRMTGNGEEMGIFLIDLFGNELLLHVEGPGCYDPMPLLPRTRPRAIPPRREFNPQKGEGVLFVADVYQGTHMQNVDRGTVKWLRVVESPEKRHWARGSWNGQGYTAPGMNWHGLENKRILGTVPVEEDGSAHFAIPADTFVYFQLLDKNGMMIQSMRSGTVVQSGETTGCIGCHDGRHTAPPEVDLYQATALTRAPSRLKTWYGPNRTFSFTAEVQPVFDKHCVRCHDYGQSAGNTLNLAPDPTIAFNTAYHELWRKGYVKCIGAGPAEIQPAYSWGSHASRLMQELLHPTVSEHNDVRLSKEELNRIATWIDLNGVYYPKYACAYPESLTGRCPLTPEQLARLSQLTGIPIDPLRNHASNQGPQVSFRRPELSVCLTHISQKEQNAKYQEALSIIQTGKKMLDSRPRADMPGFVPCDADRQREIKYARRQQIEQHNRNAIRQGRRVYDPSVAGAMQN